jgi:hypothetical protein
MPGVFRDPSSGTYRYYSYNDYEERRRRDWDDRQQGRTPYGPPLPPRWEPALPSIGFGPPQPAPPPEPEPEVFDFEEFRARINAAYEPPDTAGILAVINGDQVPRTDNTWFDRLVESLPKSIGEKPAFDAVFENPQETTIDYRSALEVLEAASG